MLEEKNCYSNDRLNVLLFRFKMDIIQSNERLNEGENRDERYM